MNKNILIIAGVSFVGVGLYLYFKGKSENTASGLTASGSTSDTVKNGLQTNLTAVNQGLKNIFNNAPNSPQITIDATQQSGVSADTVVNQELLKLIQAQAIQKKWLSKGIIVASVVATNINNEIAPLGYMLSNAKDPNSQLTTIKA